MTHEQNCSHLDAYLAGDVSSNDEARFLAHLDRCSDCQDAVDQQQWIDGLLQSPERIELERAPDSLFESIRISRTRRRRAQRAACGLAAAALLLVAITQITTQTRGTLEQFATVRKVDVTGTTLPSANKEPATFVCTPDAIAIPLESPAADVTIVQVYPTTDTERRWQLELALPSRLKDTNGG